MKPYVIGRSIFFREIAIDDAEFVIKLRLDPEKNKHLSATPNDIDHQRLFIATYLKNQKEYYFIINNLQHEPIGTIRIYDIVEDSFCWGSWILTSGAPKNAAIESALLIYDFAFFSLHYLKSHFDVRHKNVRVIDFHQRFGAKIVREDDLNVYFEFSRESYLDIRQRYVRYLP